MSNEKQEKTNDNEAQLKKTIASLRRKVTLLEKDVQLFKTLDREGDELNEKRIAQIDELKSIVAQLQDKILKYEDTILKQATRLKELEGDIRIEDANAEYRASLPWYKKIFSR